MPLLDSLARLGPKTAAGLTEMATAGKSLGGAVPRAFDSIGGVLTRFGGKVMRNPIKSGMGVGAAYGLYRATHHSPSNDPVPFAPLELQRNQAVLDTNDTLIRQASVSAPVIVPAAAPVAAPVMPTIQLADQVEPASIAANENIPQTKLAAEPLTESKGKIANGPAIAPAGRRI